MLIFNPQKMVKIAFIAGLTISAQISIGQTNDNIPATLLEEVMETAQAVLLLQKWDLFRKSYIFKPLKSIDLRGFFI